MCFICKSKISIINDNKNINKNDNKFIDAKINDNKNDNNKNDNRYDAIRKIYKNDNFKNND